MMGWRVFWHYPKGHYLVSHCSTEQCKPQNYLQLLHLNGVGNLHGFGGLHRVSHRHLEMLYQRTYEHVVLELLLLLGDATMSMWVSITQTHCEGRGNRQEMEG